jgi:hypothetical protein
MNGKATGPHSGSGHHWRVEHALVLANEVYGLPQKLASPYTRK